MKKNLDKIVAAIAKEHLNISTLETRNSDHLDFHELAVWAIKRALEAAYQAGAEDTMPRSRKLQLIREAIEAEHLLLPYTDKEEIVREWMPYPLKTLHESLHAGFIYPDADNPHTRKSKR
jgi:hypothetical protein